MKDYAIYYDQKNNLYFINVRHLQIKLTSAILFKSITNDFLNNYIKQLTEFQFFQQNEKLTQFQFSNDGYLGQLTKENQYKIDKIIDKYFL